MFKTITLLLLLGFGIGQSHAQDLGSLKANSGAYYSFADPTDITVEVKVWGAVAHAGLYEIRQGINLSTLLTLAGGPDIAQHVKGTNKTLSIRLFRADVQGDYSLLTEITMQDEVLLLRNDPVLLNNDILVVEEVSSQRFNWRDALSIMTSLGTLVLVFERFLPRN